MSDKRISTVRLIWLEAFVEVARCRTYKEAGEKLKLDPTVIKKYILSLETWLQKTLHYRWEEKIQISEDGEEFLPKAKTIIELLDSSRDFMITSDNFSGSFKKINSFLAKHMRNEAS